MATRSRGSKKKSPERPNWLTRIRMRFERWYENIEALGFSLHGAQFFLIWWKRLGIRWSLALLFTFIVPLAEYSLLSFVMNQGVPLMIGNLGVRFEAEEWKLHLWGPRGVARKVRLVRDQHSAPVLTADEIEFNVKVKSLVTSLVTKRLHFDEVVIRGADVLVEQSLVHEVNWKKFLDSVKPENRDKVLSGAYQSDAIYFERVRVAYVEETPSNSGNGVIQTTQSRIYVDDVSGEFIDLIQAEKPEETPTRFELKGRSAEGIVQVSGRSRFFAPSGQKRGVEALNAKIYLENIGMGAFSRTVPTTIILPARGTLRGTIEVFPTSTGLDCRSNLLAEGLYFVPNPQYAIVPAVYRQLENDLRTYSASSPFDLCKGGRTASGLLASFNSQTTVTAPRSVRLAVARDQQGFGTTLADSITSDLASHFARTAGAQTTAIVGAQTGAVIENALAPKPTPTPKNDEKDDGTTSNPVVQGAKGIGKGFKRLFGGK
jgi:hypothetical protein